MIKLVCINIKHAENVLTLDKVYESNGGPAAQYQITCDDGVERYFSTMRFIELEEYRNNKINSILK